MIETPALTDRDVDVVICGGGMAGLTLALQLRQTLPALSVTVVEPIPRPLPPGAHKVGESTVELGSIYLRRLGLRDYLEGAHIIKLALRFFPGGGELPLEQRDELGPPRQPLMVSYQLDRGALEADLRAMVEAAGAALLEGARVSGVELASGDAPHAVRIERGAEAATLGAGWVVDATGRRALIRKLQKSTRPAEHRGSAGWFRVDGRLDVSEMVDRSDAAFHGRPTAGERWRSTIHLMGEGYWVWIIPLVGDRTSVGVVTHEPHHGFDAVRTFDRCVAFLGEHEPAFARALADHIERGGARLDFRCIKRYSNNVERFISADRWSLVGEAGAFHDPLYSPGADSIALSNSLTVEAIRAWSAGDPLAARADELEAQLQATVRFGFQFFGETGVVYRHARAMTTKYYWDNFMYWSFLCQYYAQKLYRQRGALLDRFLGMWGAFAELNARAQRLIRTWARLDAHRPEGRFVAIPAFPSLLIEANLSLLNEMDGEETLEYMALRRRQARQMLAELALRILAELGPEAGARLIDETGLAGWGLALPRGRLEAEDLEGEARRRELGKMGRELDDNLYPLRPHAAAREAMRLLPAAG